MAILGVLLGVTMTVLAGVIWWGKREHKKLIDGQFLLMDKVVVLERRKSVLAEAATSQPKPVGVGATKLRSWSEDAAEATN